MRTIEAIRFVKECYPEYAGQLFLNLTDTANLFGLRPEKMRQHIIEYCVPYYRPVREKMYCVLEVLESIQKTRWKQ
jgi:hypothetical protein